MGTLTGSTPSLDAHCPHKLPTSCRLTATSLCCACQDKRPHSNYYSVYVDGIGLVNRGTRWQRYCYFCKEFWNNRIAATEPRMSASESKIPEYPDQGAFLERWFEYHRGYRIETEGEAEKKVEVKPEKPWREVDPGTLPVISEEERLATVRVQQQRREEEHTEDVSLEDAMDRLLQEADTEGGQTNAEVPAQPSPAQQRSAARALARFNATLEADLAALEEAQQRLTRADELVGGAETLRAQCARVLEEAEASLREQQTIRRQIQRERNALQAQLQRTRGHFEASHQRQAQHFARVFGTREEFEQQGAAYVSPLTNLFTRAYERYSIAEEVRREERASVETSERLRNLLQYWRPENAQTAAVAAEFQRAQTLDDEEAPRPEPMTDDAMTVKLECKVCLQQIADTAVLPCGHLVMCSFCADICIPTAPTDKTRPIGKPYCPLCRKAVKRRVMIFHAQS